MSFYQQNTISIYSWFLLVLSCNMYFSCNDISWIYFPEQEIGANYDLVSKETGSWVA